MDRGRLRFLGLCGVLALSGCGRPAPTHVLILSVDTLNRSALAAFDADAPALPHLDRLARRSRVMTRAHSTASWTLPAHASLLTGLYPDRHGATDSRLTLAEEIPRLTDALSDAGYETAGFTDGGFLHADFGFRRGFDRYDGWLATGAVRDDDGEPVDVHVAGEVAPGAHVRESEAMFSRAIRFLEDRDDEAPFFLFLQTYVVHDYFRLHPWAVSTLERAPDRDADGYMARLSGDEAGTDDDWDTLRALYHAELLNLDRGVGALLDALEETGLADNTLVVLVSDHGEGFDDERGRIHHGGRLHADLLRIPVLFAGPHIRPGRDETPLSLVDVMPTVLELVGAAVPPDLDGLSLADALRSGGGPAERTLYAMEYQTWWIDGRRFNADAIGETPIAVAAIREDAWYIRGREGEELYDTARDPRQAVTLDDERALASLRAQAELRGGRRSPARRRSEDAALDAQLRELGYVGH